MADSKPLHNSVDNDRHLVTNFGVRDEYHETLDPCNSVALLCDVLYLYIILLPSLNRRRGRETVTAERTSIITVQTLHRP